MKTETTKHQRRSTAVPISVSAMLVAIGVISSMFKGVFTIPVGPTLVFPIESTINVLSGVMLGPWYATVVALLVSIIRISIGTGTFFSLPGSIPGAFLVGFFYRYVWKNPAVGFMEILGTGIVGAILSSLIVAPLLHEGGTIAVFVAAFIPPSVIGSIIGYVLLLAIKTRVRRRVGLQFP